MTMKSYKLLNLETKTFFISCDVLFKEDIFPFKQSYKGDSPLFSDDPLGIMYADLLTVQSNDEFVSDGCEISTDEVKSYQPRLYHVMMLY